MEYIRLSVHFVSQEKRRVRIPETDVFEGQDILEVRQVFLDSFSLILKDGSVMSGVPGNVWMEVVG